MSSLKSPASIPYPATGPAPGPIPGPVEIGRALLHQASLTAPDATFCPSEVARALVGSHPDNWGPIMTPLRREAVAMAHAGRLVIYRKGKPADPSNFKGVYRLGAPRSD